MKGMASGTFINPSKSRVKRQKEIASVCSQDSPPVHPFGTPNNTLLVWLERSPSPPPRNTLLRPLCCSVSPTARLRPKRLPQNDLSCDTRRFPTRSLLNCFSAHRRRHAFLFLGSFVVCSFFSFCRPQGPGYLNRFAQTSERTSCFSNFEATFLRRRRRRRRRRCRGVWYRPRPDKRKIADSTHRLLSMKDTTEIYCCRPHRRPLVPQEQRTSHNKSCAPVRVFFPADDFPRHVRALANGPFFHVSFFALVSSHRRQRHFLRAWDHCFAFFS